MPAASKKTLLLVEDEAVLALAEKAALERYGYSVLTAISGEEAVSVVAGGAGIDLILMDINLGKGIDGTRAAELILRDHEIPVLFLSSHGEREIVEKTERITSYGYVVKSSSITVLDASIKMAFKLFEATRKAEAVLDEAMRANAVLGMTFEQSPIPMILVSSPERRFTFFNSSAEALFGLGGGDGVAGRLLDELRPSLRFADRKGAPLPAESSPLERVLRGETIDNEEYALLRGDGGRATILTSGTPIHFKGAMIGAYIAFVDITERKDQEKRLKDNEERLAFALEVSGLGEWEVDLRTDRIQRNARWAEMLGYDLSEIEETFKGGIDLQHPEDRAGVREAVLDYHEGRTDMFKAVYRMRTKGGEYKWIEDRGKIIERDEEGKPLRICGTHADIDARKRAEDRLLGERNRLRLLLRESGIGTWECDLESGEFTLDEVAASLLGRGLDDSLPRTLEAWDELRHPEDGARARDSLDRHLRGETASYLNESRMRHSTRGWVTLRERGWIVERDGDGLPLRILCACTVA